MKARLKETPWRRSSASVGVSASSQPGSSGQCIGARCWSVTSRSRFGGRDIAQFHMRCSVASNRMAARALAVLVLLLLWPAAAEARPAAAAKDGRPNILVVMTDDQALADVAKMPNVRRLLAAKGTSFSNAVDSFPLCCPSRATFITGQYAHNHGVLGNFHPFGWYGMKRRGNILPAWLQRSGYRTALIGKWLNGYGARDAHGEVPKGFDIWRGLLDVSAYDYFNFVMNRNGRLKAWGDGDFARKLVRFAKIEVIPDPGGLAGVLKQAERRLRAPALQLLGDAEGGGLLARRDRPDHRGPRPAREAVEEAVLHLVGAGGAPSRGRGHHPHAAAGTRPAPGASPRSQEQALQAAAAAELQRGRPLGQAVEPPEGGAAAHTGSDRSSFSSTTRGGSDRCWPSTTTSSASSRPSRPRGS